VRPKVPRRKQGVKKGKAKRTGATGTGPVGTEGALSGGRICAGGDQPSGQTVTDNHNTKRLDHPRGCPGGVAPDGPQAHHRCLRGRQQSSPPLYWTYCPSLHASGTDAMAQVWRRRQLLHINPPWGMIPRILAKLKDDKVRAIIVAPGWQSA